MAEDESKWDQIDTSEVVLRKGRRRSSRLSAGEERLKDAIERDLIRKKTRSMAAKRVQWSESTDLREKVKEYRRSQLCVTLDYQHIAVEEEREREGVKKWREMKLSNDTTEEEETVDEPDNKKPSDIVEGGNDDDDDGEDVYEDDLSDYDSEDDPDCDEVLETQLRVIKAKTTRLTLLPAYTDAVPIYERWLADKTNTSDLASERISVMSSQLDLFKEVLDLYNQWDDTDAADKVDGAFNSISSKLMEANEMGDPPPPVEKAIAAVLQNESVLRKQKEAYNTFVDDMVTALSRNLQATGI